MEDNSLYIVTTDSYEEQNLFKIITSYQLNYNEKIVYSMKIYKALNTDFKDFFYELLKQFVKSDEWIYISFESIKKIFDITIDNMNEMINEINK